MSEAPPATPAAERLFELPRRLEARKDFAEAAGALDSGGQATLSGVWGSSCALVAAALARIAPGPLLVVCPEEAGVDDFCDDLALFTSRSRKRFPAWETDPAERIVYDEIYGDRLRTLKLLLGPRPPAFIITSIQSLLQPVPPPETIAGNTRRLEVGRSIDADALARWLAEHRFHGTSGVELPGEFSRRGGILDIFAPDWCDPVRVELFDERIESIRRFDVATQRSIESLEEVEVTILDAGSDRNDGDAGPGDGGGGCDGDARSRAHFAAFLPERSWCLLLEPESLEQAGRHYLERVARPAAFHSVRATFGELGRFPMATAAALATGELGAACRLPIESVERFSGQFAKVRDELDRAGAGQEVFVVCQTEAEAGRLKEIFAATTLAGQGRLHFPLGRLRQGFRLATEGVVLVSGGELFHRTDLRRPVRRRAGKVIDSFLELREGDLVVHLAHGIGRYRGLRLLDKDGRIEEHLEIEFDRGTRVYVPASKIDLVQKYVGGRKARPSLAKIGSATWVRQKRAAENAVFDLAAEMLEMQAARRTRPGIALAEDTDWQREFDNSFPYHETPDQLATMEAIKSDMRRGRPMDRLLCGDVGFGKTELAIRAAFKAVDNGYQVAVLVPTTILAEQHFHTFRERMAEFPFEIAKLSRFCTGREQRQIIESLKTGRTDIVIGTHRLASRDVAFANLGLVIIDEEQRFGVEIKERLKTLRATVDVLTMTATPIPRTLHMSLVGVRDISNLQTPPEDRLAVETRVTRASDELIRHAVLRELNRGGQIYFVHNRVHDIESVAARLARIIPEAAIRIGHGQMPEAELERVMVDFVAGRFDLLLATTIVESGLDIPNVNTIFIDQAQRYGLADLHQLRGRVGRYKHRAYCYLLVDPHQHVTPAAARRLRAIEEFSDMGAGFAIAMRDLEIRGAGNILGTEQSGHLATVGYELYCQLLETAVRRLKKLPPPLSIDVQVDLPGQAHIPPCYVGQMRAKIDLYRRLRRVASDEELADFRAELIDRFGPPPPPVERMLSLTELRMDAAVWQIDSIHLENGYLVFGFASRSRIEQLRKSGRGRLRIVDDRSAYLPLPKEVVDCDAIISAAKSVLRHP